MSSNQLLCHTVHILGFCLVWFIEAAYGHAQPPVTALAVAPGGDTYVTGSQAGMAVAKWTAASESEPVRKLETTLEHIHDLAFSADGQRLVAAGGSPSALGAVEVYLWPDPKPHAVYRLSDDLIYRVRWSSDGKWLATAGHDGICRITNLQGEALAEYASHSRPVLAITPLPWSKLPNDQAARPASANWQLLSAGMDQTIQLWSFSGQRIRALSNHTAAVTDLAVNPDTNRRPIELVSTSEDRTVRLWQPDIGRMVRFLRLETVPRRVAWLAERQLLVAGDNGNLYRINVDEMQIIDVQSTHIQPVYELAVQPTEVLVGGGGGVQRMRL